jgi:hypothetical protein
VDFIGLALSLGSSWLALVQVTFVLADDLLRGLFNLSDLDKGVLAGSAILFAGLAEVGVITNSALITDSFNRVGIASITSDSFMDNLALLDLLFLEVINEHLAEAVLAVLLDLLAHDGGNRGQLLRDKSALSVALAAGESLLVDLGSVTLDAGNFLKVIFVVV